MHWQRKATVGVVLLASGVACAEGGCAPTVQAAVAGFRTNADVGAREGFRVESVRMDRVHGKAWAIVGDCEDSAKPHVAVLLPDVRTGALDEVAMIRAGERVSVVAGGDLHMQLSGIAEESGVAGKQIRVRLDAAVLGHGGAGAELRTRVVKEGIVEMMQ